MAMSTLGAQLAAINNASSTAVGGSVLPTSRRHEDAIGRGLNHSVQTGHSTRSTLKLTSRASIIYQDAKKAADVPMATLKENCVSSLRQLQELDETFGKFVEPLCKNPNTERGLLTAAENSQVDSLIQDLLHRLSIQMSAANAATPTANTDGGVSSFQTTIASCLHVLEYLLRRFDLHLRPKTASTALLVLLPHHEQPYFLRLLQLIDLANLPMWAFLRPYAVPNARVSRQILSKQVSKDVALLREVCKLAQKNAKLGGADKSLSFVAALLIEAMTLQLQTMGSIEERTCQAILPYCVAACKSADISADYMNFGHVIASTIVECCILASEPRHVLVTSILQGLVALKESDDVMIDNGLVVALTILIQPVDKVEPHQLQVGSFVYGCTLDKHVLQTLSKVDKIAERLGRLQEEFLEVRHWIASILVFGWTRVKPHKNSDNKKSAMIRQLLLDLILDSRLQVGLWKPNDGAWVQAYSAHIVANAKISEGKAIEDDFARTLLKEVRSVDIAAYEKGIVRALVKAKKEDRTNLAEWLGLKKDTVDDDQDMEVGDADGSIILPPRVALEHADASVRLEAIPRVLEEAANDNMDINDGDNVDDSLQQALLRRFVDDSDANVAMAAGDALLGLFEKKCLLQRQEAALESLHKWDEASNLDEKSRVKLLTCALRISACMAKHVQESNGVVMTRLVEGVASFLGDPSKKVSQEAAKAVAVSLKGEDASTTKHVGKHAKVLLVSDDRLLADLRRKWSSSEARTDKNVRRRLMPILLQAFEDAQNSTGSDMEKLASAAVEYCSWAIASFSHDMKASEKKSMTQCLHSTSQNIAVQTEKLPAWFHSLAEVDETVFSEVFSSFFIVVCKGVKTKRGDSVPAIAVLLEAALCSSSSLVINNLLQVVSQCLAGGGRESSQFGFVPILSLIAHPNEQVRRKAVDIVTTLGKIQTEQNESEWAVLNELSEYVASNKSSALLGGEKFLSNLFAAVCPKQRGDALLKRILGLCVCSVASCTPAKLSSLPESVRNSWMEVGQVTGGHKAALSIIKAAATAGEAACPITVRWKCAGKPIVDMLMASQFSGEVPPALCELIDDVISILKGVKITDAGSQNETRPTTIITSGPTRRGGRTRSYSFGKSDGVQFLRPYPKDMQESILSILSGINNNSLTRQVGGSLFHSILCSRSWGEHVFVGLSRPFAQDVSSAALLAAVQAAADGAEEAFFSLRLGAADLSALMEKEIEESVSVISYVSEYINTNAKRLANDSSARVLYPVLFLQLEKLSSDTTEHDDSNEFARQTVLEALYELVQALSAEPAISSFSGKPQTLSNWVTLLVNLGGGQNSNIRTLESIRSRRANFTLLATLCAKFPAAVVKKLVPALATIVLSATSEKEARMSSESLALLVPVLFQHAGSADTSPATIINSFLSAVKDVENDTIRALLYQAFSKAAGKAAVQTVGPFVSACLACEVNLSAPSDNERNLLTRLADRLLFHLPTESKMNSLLSMVNYSRDIILSVAGPADLEFQNEILATVELVKIARDGPIMEAQGDDGEGDETRPITNEDRSVLLLAISMMSAVSEIAATPKFRKFVRQIDGDAAVSVLRFWEDLLQLQSTYNSLSSRGAVKASKIFWETMGGTINDTLSTIHNVLPSHLFLAFASSLIKEGGNTELRARAVQLVAEGAATLEPLDHEASLYLDMIPFLTALLEEDENDSLGTIVQQSSLATIETILRLLCIPAAESRDVKRYTEQFSVVLTKSVDVIERRCTSLDKQNPDFSTVSSASAQLICSAALCVATTVRICGPRTLAVLPKLTKSLFLFLAAANAASLSRSNNASEPGEVKLAQLSVLRVLRSTVESIPQFSAPFLGGLFQSTAFPCGALWSGDDEYSLSVKDEARKLQEILTSRVPARLLIPAASAAIVKLEADDEILCLLSVLTKSVQNSRGTELARQANSLLKAATFGFDHKSVSSLEHPRVVASSDLLTSLILKLSEVQLRSLYAKLREWRRDIDQSDPSKLVNRRVAFWSLSAGLAKKLKSIYLPCLTSIFSDAIDELEVAVTALCKQDKALRKADRKKKQRLETAKLDGFRHESLLSLQALLLCLESSLKSDALAGGTWVRDGDSKRFNMLLDSLSKLLQSRLSQEMSTSIDYQSVVQGEGSENGSVVDCLVALAAAAGDEQLWKPLNHAVLQACSDENRGEVRKAGITCLHSLITSIGEEYMVLIPECLPVLSELLEDSDETIAGLAQDCIAQSEELLGESLEDNL